MRKLNPLEALFPKTRQAILAATLMEPVRSWYLTDLARKLEVSPSSLQREALVAGRGRNPSPHGGWESDLLPGEH